MLVLSLVCSCSFGQSDYYVTDSTTMVGVSLKSESDASNSKYCKLWKNKDQVKKLGPDKVLEYGFKDGRVYVSREVQIYNEDKKVFLERLVNGDTKLYYYKSDVMEMYYIEAHSSSLIEIPKGKGAAFREQLSEITKSCDKVTDATKLVKYHKSSMTRYFQNYNNCESKPFPFFKYGIIAGGGMSKLNSASPIYPQLDQLNYPYRFGYMFGLFIDQPIQASDYSFHMELYFSKYSYTHSLYTGDRKVFLDVEKSTIVVPLLMRYTFPKLKTKPFINFGAIVSYDINNEHTMKQDIISGENTFYENTFIDNNQLGFALGSGLEFKLNYRRSLFCELRFSKFYGLDYSNSINSSRIELMAAVNI